MITYSDSKLVDKSIYLGNINITDKDKQNLHFSISKEIPSILNSKANSVFNKVFGLSLTRFSLQRNQLLIPYLLSENFTEILNDNDECRLILSKKNKLLGEYLLNNVVDRSKINIEYHKKTNYWINGLTKESFFKQMNSFVLAFSALVYVCFSILIFRFIKKKHTDIEWMSFANNKESIDYSIIEKIKAINISISLPGLIPFQNKYSRLLFRSRSYSMRSFMKFSYDLLKFLVFNKIKLNGLDEKYPTKFHLSFNSISELIYQYLLSFETNEITNTCVFRGGNANGIWRNSLNKNTTTILLSHGTEIHPLDHAIYMFVNYYILPSKQIAEKWLNHENNLILGKLITIGRPFYETLRLSVKPKVKINNNPKVIGIVLTYSSDERTKSFITDLYNSFNNYDNITFLIKERSNFNNDLNYLPNFNNINIHSGDIFTFLAETDLVVAGISDLSVLGMTVLDAISLDIPAIYFTQNRSKTELGYSYCDEMNDYTFKDIIYLKELITNYTNFNEFLKEVSIRNKSTKNLLGPNHGVIDKFVDFVVKTIK